MRRVLHGRRPWFYSVGALGLALVGFGAGQHLGAVRPTTPPRAAIARLPADVLLSPVAAANLGENGDSVIQAQQKRVMGRLRSLEMVRRVATEVRPLLDRAIELPSIQDDLRALAASAGMGLPEYKEYFKGKQGADLLLESGGDPNARSVADAIGVAQFMPGTGRRVGLRVDLAASNRLSRKLWALEREISALEAKPDGWTKPVPTSLDPSGRWNRDQWLNYRKQQRESLVARRRQVDHRFDPEKSILAQTKYLVKLTRRYGSVDWALQAYHGGEGGANRTLRLFGAGPPPRLASRGGFSLGDWGKRTLPYSELYARVSPRATPDAFGYLFGRSDDHRYYWWKVLMAERALNLYRQDAQEFERQWQALKPGYNIDYVWYPHPDGAAFQDDSALAAAYASGTLVALPHNAADLGLRTDNLASLSPGSAYLHKGLRPEAMGALLRLVQLYRSHGGKEPLTALALVQSEQYRERWNARYPERPLPPGVPRDPEFHTTGFTFDLKTPAREWDRKVLEFALGRLYDTLRVSWRQETEAGSRRYHVVVNPEFKGEMEDYYRRAVR